MFLILNIILDLLVNRVRYAKKNVIGKILVVINIKLTSAEFKRCNVNFIILNLHSCFSYKGLVIKLAYSSGWFKESETTPITVFWEKAERKWWGIVGGVWAFIIQFFSIAFSYSSLGIVFPFGTSIISISSIKLHFTTYQSSNCRMHMKTNVEIYE